MSEQLSVILADYYKQFPEEQGNLDLLEQQLQAGHDMQNDRTLPGHATASAWVLAPDRQRLLLIHHNFLQRWLQPGGHIDPEDTSPLVAAQREAFEETGVQIAEYLPLLPDQPLVPFDLGTHPIPDRPAKQMPAHHHHDFRYLFVAASEDLTVEEKEISQLGWFAFDAPECDGIREVIDKLVSLQLIRNI